MNKKSAAVYVVCGVRNKQTILTFLSALLLPRCSACSVLKRILGKQVQGFEDSVLCLCIFLFVRLQDCVLKHNFPFIVPLSKLEENLYGCTIILNRKILISCASFIHVFKDLSEIDTFGSSLGIRKCGPTKASSTEFRQTAACLN